MIVIFLSFLVFAHPLPAQKKPRIVPVGVARVQELATQSSYSYPGTVQAWATTKLASEVEGRVKAMLFQEGDYVKKRTPLVKLRIDPLILQRRLVRAEKKMVEIRLEELLAGTRTETIEAARSAVAQSEAKVHLAENELRRIKKLFKEGVLSLDEFDKADSQAQAARAELEEKQSVLNELVAGPRAEKIKQETANLKAAEARLQMIQDDINRATIKAPFNGYIVKKETEVGQWLEKGDPAVSMIAAKPLKVEIHVPQFQFNRIQMGASARIIFEHFGPTGGEKVFKGTVVEKIRVGDPVSRTFPVRLKVSRPNSQLAPGMLVRVELKVGKRRDKTLFVPKDAIVRTPRDTSVWIVRQARDKTMKAHKVAVQTGRHEKNLIAVQFDKHKIKPGDWVVVQGNERLKPKMRVKIISRIQ
ncbi:MAG: efflux RND transporter periplasmic adaptor subunit [Nitrospinaceae bacterium]|nr:efflux RND transporter periplasmic adaptor subunit [Nitrospinaceae bacterium]NIR57466.1 efflux RND transporter periplasmic adaptor subunit [Nitrospinaceae bacterium]NIS87933.1 efflux RND transporter periplasmic adaptor subunit [Nitrospinaceae bacterium]NIT84801.1 efflux RND transporter periplasmic adaptor subunit [Nitrospinaceae bacterium]NIU46977.1 efflux RND transporter periplasmic adaptor subunit [Nitrospinaceae bacterium]